MPTAYLALGSNLQTPRRQLASAIKALNQLSRTCISKQSQIYRTKPLGRCAQPTYLNMVVALRTTLSPTYLLQYCASIEQKHQRIRKKHWGSRTLDIDILLYDDIRIHLPHLQIPHPQMQYRDFVLVPLLEIAPNICFPNGQPISTHSILPSQTIIGFCR